jgi:hypothetical protein
LGKIPFLITDNLIAGATFLKRICIIPIKEGLQKMASTEKNETLIKAAKQFENVPWCEDYERMISGML